MNRIRLTLATSILLITSGFGTLAQQANSLLWKVTGKDVTTPSYIFGTIHMLPEANYFFTPKMKEALDATQVLALEVDLDVPIAEQMKMAGQMMMPEGKSWADYMTAKEYAAVKSAFVDSLGFKAKKLEKYSRIKPIYVTGIILSELLGNVKMYEKELTALAKKGKKTIIGLETFQEQMDIVGSIPLEDQIKDLKTTTASMVSDYNEMLAAYTAQDLTELERAGTKDESFDKMEAKLLTERNDRWVTFLKEKLATTPTFYAVGAMHLVGDNGLLNQLREAGYTVEAVQ